MKRHIFRSSKLCMIGHMSVCMYGCLVIDHIVSFEDFITQYHMGACIYVCLSIDHIISLWDIITHFACSLYSYVLSDQAEWMVLGMMERACWSRWSQRLMFFEVMPIHMASECLRLRWITNFYVFLEFLLISSCVQRWTVIAQWFGSFFCSSSMWSVDA